MALGAMGGLYALAQAYRKRGQAAHGTQIPRRAPGDSPDSLLAEMKGRLAA
jgi:hypothetical protein